MDVVSVTNELKARETEKVKELLDKFAGSAMQSLMQHWLRLDEFGCERNDYLNKDEFCSLASSAMAMGWGSDHPHGGKDVSYADELADLSYFIASKMLKQRSEYHKLIDEVNDAKATEKTASS